jgi:predicted homoserine dehydrogenase-like protein
MEAPVSIARAALYGEATGSPKERVGEVVAATKRRLEPGDVLDGEGGTTVYGILVDATQASAERLLPIGLCHGARMVRPAVEGQMLGHGHVELPKARDFVLHLRELQLETSPA